LPNALRLTRDFLTVRPASRPVHTRPTTPNTQPLPGITHARFSLIRFRSPLLTESPLFSLPTGTEMFHFPAFPPHTLCIQVRVTPHDWRRVTPFGHPGITARLTTPPGLSRPPTSFLGPWCPGIHRPPLPTYPTHITHHRPANTTTTTPQTPQTPRCSRPLCKSQPTTNPPPHHHPPAATRPR